MRFPDLAPGEPEWDRAEQQLRDELADDYTPDELAELEIDHDLIVERIERHREPDPDVLRDDWLARQSEMDREEDF